MNTQNLIRLLQQNNQEKLVQELEDSYVGAASGTEAWWMIASFLEELITRPDIAEPIIAEAKRLIAYAGTV